MEHNTTELRRLPVSTQEFTEVREDNLVYVDKTDLIWKMANAPEKVAFFARPRRFGKTMLISTLEAYFQGRKEYFEGLKIMELEKDWKEYQVLRFDLSGSVTALSFNERLSRQLEKYEKLYGIVNTYTTPGVRFETLIEIASKGKREVVCLFDEYDYPLQHTLFHQEEEHEKLKAIYRDFFAVLKAQSRYIKFVFLTGITKFTGLSLFSVMNNISNISFWPEYQEICGITEKDLRTELLPYVAALAEKNSMTVDEALQEIKKRYDGYHFCEEMQEIYNPYCLINALNRKKLDDFWVESGNTQMLIDAVEDLGWQGTDFEGLSISRRDLEHSDVNTTDLAIFLYQSGYLTIKEANEELYTLGIPNTETRYAIYRTILPRLAEKRVNVVSSSIIGIKKALRNLDILTAFQHMQALVAETPYSKDKTVKAVEEKFQFILKNALFLCNCRVIEELHVATGRIDLVAEHPKCLIVMELKMTANGGLQAAEEQIARRDYAASFAMSDRPVYTVAIEFNGETRQMGEPVVVSAQETLKNGEDN